MAIKKSQLYSTLWMCCDALRGGIDPSIYKNYVLMILFVKYISDKSELAQATNQKFRLKVPEGCYFNDFIALKGKTDIAEQIDTKLQKILEANQAYIKDVNVPTFDTDELGEKLSEKWSKLIGAFQREELDFGKNRAADDDILGDAYEYLMKNFAVQGGKSKGQFYTPGEVSRLIASVLNLGEFQVASNTFYDPTCGSGSLLLRALDETNGKPKLYGQEFEPMTVTLAKLNMILHGVVNADIRTGDTLNSPQLVSGESLNTFDICIANPPFSRKGWLDDNASKDDKYGRWSEEMLPPNQCGDYAFLRHLIASMKPETGRGACILPHGVLFRGNVEYDLRKSIVDKGYIKGIIGLPANIFYGTGIPACILIIDKNGARDRKGIFFIDAKDGYMKDAAKNRLRERDIKKIIDTWNAFQDVPHYARFVPMDEIKGPKNDYNLNIPRYIQPVDTEIIQDIERHLKGDLPKHDIDEMMQEVWRNFPELKKQLFTDKGNFYSINCTKDSISNIINSSPDIKSAQNSETETLSKWIDEYFVPRVEQYDSNTFVPKAEIEQIGNSILGSFAKSRLVGDYSTYELLRNYWADVMQDDFYIISADGWKVSATPSYSFNAKKIEERKLIRYYYDPLTDELVTRVYFQEIADRLAVAQSKEDAETQIFEDFVEENALGYFDDLRYIRFKITKTVKKKMITVDGYCCEKCVKARFDELKKIKVRTPEQEKEYNELDKYLSLLKNKKDATRAKNAIAKELKTAIDSKYTYFFENRDKAEIIDEIRNVVIHQKWEYDLKNIFKSAVMASTQSINASVTELASRYECTLSQLTERSADLEQKVMSHINKMGFSYGE